QIFALLAIEKATDEQSREIWNVPKDGTSRAVVVRMTDRNISPRRGKRGFVFVGRADRYDIDDQVVPLAGLQVVLFLVVDNVIRAQRLKHRQLFSAIDGSHMRAIRLCDLNRDGPHASAGAVDQNGLSSRPFRAAQIRERDHAGSWN